MSSHVRLLNRCADPAAHLAFLLDLLARISPDKFPQAHVRLLSTVAHAKLLYGDLEGTRVDMEECARVLDALDGVEPTVHAAYYGVASDYYKARADYAPYYKHSLLYLACVNTETDMSPAERLSRAHDLGISALLGATIYNFGELVRAPPAAAVCRC